MNIMRRPPPPVKCPRHWKLDAPFIALSANKADRLTLGDCFEHFAIFGGTGSGKSSGSARALARTFLNAGFGGVVCCAKPEEAQRWIDYAKECGREKSVIRMDATGTYRFNFIDYLLGLPSELGGGLVDNVVHTLLHLLQVAQGNEGQGERGDFWVKSMRELLSNAIASLYYAYGSVRLDQLLQLVTSAPVSEKQALDASFQSWSMCYQTVRLLFEKPAIPLPPGEAKVIAEYFGQRFGRLDARTRSNIVITLSAEISPFLRGPLHRLFATDTNITPEAVHEGVILLLDLPLKRFDHAGRIAQLLMKYLFQKATERRKITDVTRPVFLFADEAQFFVSPYDMEFLSTARSARAATVYITQNLPTLYASVGGAHPQDRIDALMGNFQTKIFHANSCHRTNEWAANLIGKSIQRRASRSWSHGSSSQWSEGTSGSWSKQEGTSKGRSWGGGVSSSWNHNGEMSVSFSSNSGGQTGSSTSTTLGGGWSQGTTGGTTDTDGGGWSEQMDHTVQPADFANKLQQGGARNNFIVTGILLQANRVFSRTGACWMPVALRQR